MVNPKAAVAVAAAAGLTAGQLIFTGACLAVGFSLGHMLMRKISEAYDAKRFGDLEQQAPTHA